ncbi:MAG: prepilin-type N-terminal cleavage/methylation domain-containing protein [Methylococcaceae bacterium]|nr:MAG: prepilin-type N-terminal cleavage/methylation domain-containing protein [Methylococcaceae bacterium]
MNRKYQRMSTTSHAKCGAPGFTLLELLVTIAIMVVTLMIGVPAFRETIQNSRQSTQANEWTTDISLARSEAIKRGAPVTLCKRNSAGNGCDNAADWVSGWVVFADDNGNGVVDADEQILRLHGPLTGLSSLHYPQSRITYAANGFAAGYSGTMTFCDSRGADKARGLVLSNTGRLRAANSSDTLTCL